MGKLCYVVGNFIFFFLKYEQILFWMIFSLFFFSKWEILFLKKAPRLGTRDIMEELFGTAIIKGIYAILQKNPNFANNIEYLGNSH